MTVLGLGVIQVVMWLATHWLSVAAGLALVLLLTGTRVIAENESGLVIKRYGCRLDGTSAYGGGTTRS